MLILVFSIFNCLQIEICIIKFDMIKSIGHILVVLNFVCRHCCNESEMLGLIIQNLFSKSTVNNELTVFCPFPDAVGCR